jgi:hypothetical protein
MARILKDDSFKTLLQQGLKEKIVTETVKDRWLLVVIFGHQAHVGMVKVLARKSSGILANILELVERRGSDRGGPRFRHLGKATVDTIDLIFKDDDRSNDEEDVERAMALINVAAREIHGQIVFYDSGLSGKTTNLQYIHSRIPQDTKGSPSRLRPRRSTCCSSTSCRWTSARYTVSPSVFTSTPSRVRSSTSERGSLC